MKTGTVKFFNGAKGYGFIKEDGTDEEIFVHITGLNTGSLNEGDVVKFNTKEGKKGLNAVDVELV